MTNKEKNKNRFDEAVFQASRKNQKSGEKDREDGEERVRRKSGVF